ncbi:L-lysine exporter family protein LysE/ArgO [Arthrobacter sp. CAN_A6]|uniref:LysE/ArgO family amino acid transporter n=1 Tax=Arthrobacter sp. CAN_A6 TaxID=2787721 RepID=UPI0018C9BA77
MTSLDPVLSVLSGLGIGLGLIVAIGAQNAYVLRLGIQGTNRTIAPVVLICAVSDALLIMAGIVGIGALIERAPSVIVAVRILGAGFLIAYGLFAARRAFRPAMLVVQERAAHIPTKTAMATIVALTWLNPQVYLDTLIFLGSIANQQGDQGRWWWGGGAVAASFLWFFSLGFGARLLRPLFARPTSWRVLDIFIAIIMLGLGIHMATGF